MGVSASPLTIPANPSQESDPQTIRTRSATGTRSARPGAGGWEAGIRRPECVDCGVHHRMRGRSGNRSCPTISGGGFTTVGGANREFLTTRSSSGEFTARPARKGGHQHGAPRCVRPRLWPVLSRRSACAVPHGARPSPRSRQRICADDHPRCVSRVQRQAAYPLSTRSSEEPIFCAALLQAPFSPLS
jgi:hypothetical protein